MITNKERQKQKLQTNNLTIGYANKVIAKALNLELLGGEMVCLLGQNGVGKSTLLRTLSMLQEPIQGEILIGQVPIANIDRRELATRLGIITTEKIGVSNMTVRELVGLGRYPYTNWMGKETTSDTDMIEGAISQCRIDYIRDAKLSAISDGQFQKAMIARVLAQDTDIILMDEPTAHLDVVNRVEIFQLLKQIKQKTNKSILISTHELDLSMQFADKLWLMDFNAPIVVGSPEDLGMAGAIEKIFYHNEFALDASTGQVRLAEKHVADYHVVGQEKAVVWVNKALKRSGYGISETGEKIEVSLVEKRLHWRKDEKVGVKVVSLLAHLK